MSEDEGMTPTATGEERSALPEPIYSTYPPASRFWKRRGPFTDGEAQLTMPSDVLYAKHAPLHLLEKEESDA